MSHDLDLTHEQLLNKLAETFKDMTTKPKIKFECPHMEATCDYMEDLIEASWNLAKEIQPIIDKFSLDADFHIDQFHIDKIQVLINKLRGMTPIHSPRSKA